MHAEKDVYNLKCPQMQDKKRQRLFITFGVLTRCFIYLIFLIHHFYIPGF